MLIEYQALLLGQRQLNLCLQHVLLKRAARGVACPSDGNQFIDDLLIRRVDFDRPM